MWLVRPSEGDKKWAALVSEKHITNFFYSDTGPKKQYTRSSRCRYTLRFARAEPCDCPVHRPIVTCGVLVECSGPMKIGWLGIRARPISQPILSHLLCDYPIRAQWPFKSTFTSFNHDGEDGLRMHWKAPMLLRDICVSCNMEFFCRTNIKPRNALPVTLDCSQYGGSRFKKYRRCHGLCV